MHDIGRITLTEPAIIRVGYTDDDIARWGAEIISQAPYLERIADHVRRLHEPYRKPGEQSDPAISTISKIVRATSAYDHLVVERELSALQAIEVLHQGAAYDFDPHVVAAMRRVLERRGAFHPGASSRFESLVRPGSLASGSSQKPREAARLRPDASRRTGLLEPANRAPQFELDEAPQTDRQEHIAERQDLAVVGDADRNHVGQKHQPRGLVEHNVLEAFGDHRGSGRKPGSNFGGLGQDRHAAVEGDDDEVHQDAEAGEPEAGAVPVDDDQKEQRDVAQTGSAPRPRWRPSSGTNWAPI